MPNRYYDVGIAEEHAVIFAGGMATMGYHPVVRDLFHVSSSAPTIASFTTSALQDLPVIFCMDRAGLSRQDGPTHHGLVRHLLSALGCQTVIAMAPKDEDELVDMMFTATHRIIRRSSAIRAAPAEGVPVKDQPQADRYRQGGGRSEFFQRRKTEGRTLRSRPDEHLARKVAAQLAAEGFDVAVINPRFTKPIDAGTTEFFGRAADVVVTLEDHVLMGGYGTAVLELFNEKNVTTPVVRIGWPDQFIEHATTVDELRKKYGLTVENTVTRVKAELAEIATPAERRSGLVVA